MIETVVIDGRPVETLADLLRPGLRAVVVGINPSPTSVAAGHFYQGRFGHRMWQHLVDAGIVTDLPPGAEDDAAFAQGIGFTDLYRAPTPRAADLRGIDLRSHVPDLVARILPTGARVAIFVFSQAYKLCASAVEAAAIRAVKLPAPFAGRDAAAKELANLRAALA